jgi:murein DD-endopeptidase MepM/ murein hydrolase activator NlpD
MDGRLCAIFKDDAGLVPPTRCARGPHAQHQRTVKSRQWVLPMAALALALATTGPIAQTAYRYRDTNGQWVFTDRAPSSSEPSETMTLARDKGSPHIMVERAYDDGVVQLIATNECLCTVTYLVSILKSDFPAVVEGHGFRATLAPSSRHTLIQVKVADPEKTALTFRWKAALGSPTAVHNPSRPYRAPFAVGTTYAISQAYPTRITHVTPDSQYAVDMVLPDDTPIYAAREGVVINTRHDSFRGGADPTLLDQANVVEILHDDGTIAIYAHLHWDSIRVRVGQTVARGEYIADSGATGFSTGPHLHFAVVRNSGSDDVSIPVQFAGFGGSAITPVTNGSMTAY